MKPALASLLVFLTVYAAESGDGLTFRFAISETLVGKTVTPQDTKQAMETWASEIKRQVPHFAQFEIALPGSADLGRRFRNGEFDGIVVTPFEYAAIAPFTDPAAMVNEAAPDGEEFVLLVHRDSAIKSVADLKGRKLAFHDHPKTMVARLWIDTLLANHKFGSLETFFSSVSAIPKLNLTVLSVFFKTNDVCLVSKRSFETLTEMNPQLGARLQALAVSPRLVTSLLVFRKNCPPPQRQEFERALTLLKTAPAGQQALALFDGTGLVRADISVLKPSLDLIALHERLRPKTGAPK